jgi:hypothetical protein
VFTKRDDSVISLEGSGGTISIIAAVSDGSDNHRRPFVTLRFDKHVELTSSDYLRISWTGWDDDLARLKPFESISGAKAVLLRASSTLKPAKFRDVNEYLQAWTSTNLMNQGPSK